MMMSKRTYEREYTEYKQRLDSQLANFITNSQAELDEYQLIIQEKDDQLEKYEALFSAHIEKQHTDLSQQIHQLLTD